MKVLINSYPRSGTSTFVHAIYRGSKLNSEYWSDIWFYGENWIAKSHVPAFFYATFPSDIVAGTVLRDPVDAISSNVFRWTNGYTGNIVNNKIVIDNTIANKENKFDEQVKMLIDHQIKQYSAYYYSLSTNYKNFLMFEYKDIKKDAIPFVRQIIKKAGGDYFNIDTAGIKDAMDNPNLPTKEKTDLYYLIRNYIELKDSIYECYKFYNELSKYKNNGLFI